MFRRATTADREAVTALYEATFADPHDFACTVFDSFAGVDNIFVAEQDGAIASALFSVPVTLLGKQGAYYYGLCTSPNHRGKGLMSGLIAFAKQQHMLQNRQFAVLIPANASLFDFYRKNGFETAFYKRQLRRPIKYNLWAQAEFDTITASGLQELRKKYAPRSVFLPSAAYRIVLADLYSGGVTSVLTENGYGFYFKKGDLLEFIELFATSDSAAERLVEAARQKTGSSEALITVGGGTTTFLGEGTTHDYAMIQFFEAPFSIEDTYLRLMLDDQP